MKTIKCKKCKNLSYSLNGVCEDCGAELDDIEIIDTEWDRGYYWNEF